MTMPGRFGGRRLLGRVERCAHKHGDPSFRHVLDFCFFDELSNLRQFVERRAAAQHLVLLETDTLVA